MLVTVTETLITVVAEAGWTDEQFDAALRLHGVADEPVYLEDFTTDGWTDVWHLSRNTVSAVGK